MMVSFNHFQATKRVEYGGMGMVYGYIYIIKNEGLRQGHPTTVQVPVCLSGFFSVNPRAHRGP